MKRPWTNRTSLFARMSLLFGLLVTVPLVISGIVLSLVGSGAVRESGSRVAEVGSEVLLDSTSQFKKEAKHRLDEAADEVSKEGQKALEATHKQGRLAAEKALKANQQAMSKIGANAVEQSVEKTAAVSTQTLRNILNGLDKKNEKSLEILNNRFVDNMTQELAGSSTKVENDVAKSVVTAWDVSADRRTLSVLEYGLRRVEETVASLQLPSRLRDITEYDPEEAAQQLSKHVAKNRSDIVRVMLVSGLGVEHARVPEGEDAVDWAKPDTPEANLLQVMQTRTEYRSPILVGATGKDPVIRIAYRVWRSERKPAPAPAPGDPGQEPGGVEPPVRPDPHGMIVVDLKVSTLAGDVSDVTPPPPGLEVVLLQAGTGRVLSAARDSKLVGTLMPTLIPKRDDGMMMAPQKPGAYEVTVNNVPMRASARYWTAQNAWAVVFQPQEEVRRPIVAIRDQIQASWREALERANGDTKSFLQARLAEIRRDQEGLARQAKEGIGREARGLMANISSDLQREQDRQTAPLRRQFDRDVDAQLGKTRKAIQDAANAARRDAFVQVSTATASKVSAANDVITTQAKSVGEQAVRSMVGYSAWLVPLFLLLALFLATMTSRSIVKPINQLVKGTQALAAGEYNQRIKIRGDDELSRLAIAFNDMASAIERGQSELQQSHNSLAEEKARIEGIVSSSPDGLVLLEPTGEVAFMNPEAIRLLDLEPEQLPAAPFALAALPALGARRLQECLEHVGHSAEVKDYEITEPERRVVQLREVQLRSEGGRSYGRLLHLHDITRERVIDEMKSDFISLVSHELRTPLTSILGFSSYMLTGKMGAVPDNQKMALESIHRQAKRLSAIITDFLDVSRIESGKIEMRKDPLPVPQIASRVVEDLRPQANEKNIRVLAKVEESPYPVVALGDEQRIAQVFTNLLGNALKFTEPEGTIEVRLARMNGEVTCHVRDSGCGIPPDELDRVFDRFYQVEKVVTRKTGGTGLGLAIVKNIIEAHGGRVWIESEVGRGTEVSFTLPGA